MKTCLNEQVYVLDLAASTPAVLKRESLDCTPKEDQSRATEFLKQFDKGVLTVNRILGSRRAIGVEPIPRRR
jgi:hypothetical protein